MHPWLLPWPPRADGPRLLAGLNSEQLALVDLLVLSRAAAVVGHCMSSYSNFLRELRVLRLGPASRASFRFLPFWKCNDTFHASGGGVFAP